MASSVGSLVVRLGLDAGEFTSGLSKAEFQAQKFAQNTRSAILEVGKVLAGLEIGSALFENTKAILSQAASLQQLAGSTGSTVENLSRLSNQAQIAGTDFATMQAAVLKLSAGMAGADDESTKVKEALKILGVTARDPVQALQEAAVKLNTYADGVNKVGFAVALFGKQGPAFLATLKDIAELQDVGATVSAKQAQAADDLEKAFRRLSVESRDFANAILNDVTPALRDLLFQFTEGIKLGGGFFAALNVFGQLNFGDISGEIKRVSTALEDAKEKSTGLFSDSSAVANLQKQLDLLKAVGVQRAQSLISPANNDVRDILAQRKPQAPNPPSSLKDGKALKDRTSDAERYLQTLEKQLQGTLDLNVVEQAEVAIWELQRQSLSGLTEERVALIRDYAAQVQASIDLKKANEEQRREEEEAARLRARNEQDLTRYIDKERQTAQAMRESNESLKDNLVFLRGGEEALNRYTDAKLADTIATLKQAEATADFFDLDERLIAAIREQIVALKERQTLIADTRLAETLVKEARVLEDFKNNISDSFSNAFEGFIKGTKSAKDAFKSFVDDVESMLIKLALKKLMNQILGVDEKGPDIFSVFGKLLGSFAGAGAGAGAAAATDIGIGLGGFASGTKYAPGGWALVGENGPELMNVPRGSQIYPTGDGPPSGGGVSIGAMHFHVDGQVNSSSIRQIRNAARDGIMAAARDR